MKARRLYRNNKSGCPGVRYSEKRRGWSAYIGIGKGKVLWLGDYNSQEEATAVRKAAELKHWHRDDEPTEGEKT